MCGVAGLVDFNGLVQQEAKLIVKKMTARLSHRGPDDEGAVCTHFAALGHRRLSILDLSTSGQQPMWDAQRKHAISYNGEIYNYESIKSALQEKGYLFKTKTDTEVVLNAFIEWGPACVEKFNGIFAFAIWSEEEKKLFLVRDPVGVKPLFFSHKGSRIIFASEIKALLADPKISREQDEEALDSYFTFNYSVAPKTGFKEIEQIMPGQGLLFKNSKLEKFCYSFKPEEKIDFMNWQDSNQVVELFREKFQSTLKRQLVADVPVGTFLSGGIDSSAICTFLAAQGISPQCFHMGFNEESFDESSFAISLAQHLKLALTQFKAEINQDDLINISKHLEEPTADASALAMYQLCKQTSKHVKVVLSGDGADEVLAGYSTYPATQLAKFFKNPISKFLLQAARHLLPKKGGGKRYSTADFFDRFSRFASQPFPYDHAGWRTIFYKAQKELLYKESFAKFLQNHDPYQAFAAAAFGAQTSLAASLQMDTKFYLPNDMLVKVDRMSMAHGLEVRVPFLDLEFMNFCHQIPSDLKLRNLINKKYILKAALQGRVPRKTLSKPKTGFNFPLANNLKFKWSELFQDLMQDSHIKNTSLLDIQQVQKFYGDFKKSDTNTHYQLFGILMYFLWLRNAKTWSC